MTDYQNFELWGLRLQEARVANYLSIARFCLVAVRSKDTKGAANILGQRAGWVRRLAKVYRFFRREVTPDVPLNVYEVAAELPNPLHAFYMAIDTEYRKEHGIDDGKGYWSARQLQDWHDGQTGARVSRVKRLDGEAEVLAWEPGIDTDGEPSLRVHLEFRDCEDHTDAPMKLLMRGWEMLE